MLSEGELAELGSRGFALEIVDVEDTKQLALRDLENPALSPLTVDFLSGAMKQRFKTGTSKSEPLAKALGLRGFEHPPTVLDATAGLGTDAFIMSGMGCRVRAIEKSAAIHALLEDGLARLRAGVWAEPWISTAARLRFERGDAVEIMKRLDQRSRTDIVYLDPMFPEESHSKSALPKRTMQIFRRLLGAGDDEAALFDAAMRAAKARVVVKRPPQAPPISGKPTHQVEGKTARFDVYVITR
ncbi:MAG: class I SAM-dependent methyltransferase [Bdellovibrionota bacterium]